MSATIPAEVNAAVLEWARQQSGYPLELIARRLGVAPDRLASWEQGTRKPTVRQTQQLARFYHRPFGVFLLPQPPAQPPLAAEYRRLPGVTPGVESPEFRLALRVMSSRREAAIDLQEELGQPVPSFTTAGHLSDGPLAVGRAIRRGFQLSVDEQFAWRDDWQGWRAWRALVEAAGILVFLFPKVPLAETRGVSLLEFPLPVVGVNSREQAPGARTFSLLHEVVHIALALGQEERVALRETRNDVEWDRVERFAEEAASEIIIPGEALEQVLSTMWAPRGRWDVSLVRSLASRFRVTPLAMATRLRAAGALSWDGYQRWKAAWSTYVANLKPRKGGMATPVDKTLARAGRPFVQLVVEALDANRITAVDACRFLDLRFDHLESLRAELRTGQNTGAGNDAAE